VGDYAKVVTHFTKAIELDGTKVVNLTHRAQAYEMLGDYAKAVDDCEAILKLDPAHVQVSETPIDIPDCIPACKFAMGTSWIG